MIPTASSSSQAAWRQVVANRNLVQTATDRAVLIKLPKSEFRFWHPAKLVHTAGKNGYRVTISYTDEFTFRVFRNGQGQYNRFAKIEERALSAREFEQYFDHESERKEVA